MNTGNEPPVPADAAPEGADPHHPRDGRGRITGSYTTAQRDARAAELRDEGWKLEDIATELGYHDRSHARQGIRRALREVVRGPAEKLLQSHLERLETLYEIAMDVADADHVVVSHGKVVTDATGNPLTDHGPKLAAIREARATLNSFWDLTGMKQPQQVSVSGSVRYEVIGVDPSELT
ncbi:hypothetical protein ACFYRN_19100 [Streptomyces sp. NPDC005227]|uniref:hypothetical protein n=1 Tax=Streptomyces sp. NPDC005227 TaxID=3364707 RepID=UPI0036B4E823